jgi:exopolyphosphatase/guanosine-5'-triphosphate,3'-diphosphate pyrophosphatase
MAFPALTLPEGARAPASSPGRVGVVDIGSNSIRLVVFDGSPRAPIPIFNEKVLCGMGRRLRSTGRLDPEGVELAYANLPRFAAAARALGCRRVRAVATAAVRDALDGPVFIARARQLTDFDIEIVAGEEEARLSALGLVSALPDADGAMGDLGGGSLELVRLDAGALGPQATLPLGALRLTEAERQGEGISKLVKDTLAALPWLEPVRGRTFYAIGGAWRALARIHMAQIGYRLKVIDNYTVEAAPFRDYLQLIAKMSERSLKSLGEVPGKRVETLPVAARALRHILRAARPRFLTFSAQGLREGILYAELTAAERREDALLAAAGDLAERFGRFAGIGAALIGWTAPLFPGEPPARQRIRAAACLLSDIGYVDHPDYRARLAFDRILSLPLPGLDHPARAFLAHALYARYGGDDEPKLDKRARDVGLGEADLAAARTLGHALRLGYTISAGALDILGRAALALDGATVTLTVPRADGAYGGESVTRRLADLAASLGRRPVLATAPAATA